MEKSKLQGKKCSEAGVHCKKKNKMWGQQAVSDKLALRLSLHHGACTRRRSPRLGFGDEDTYASSLCNYPPYKINGEQRLRFSEWQIYFFLPFHRDQELEEKPGRSVEFGIGKGPLFCLFIGWFLWTCSVAKLLDPIFFSYFLSHSWIPRSYQ